LINNWRYARTSPALLFVPWNGFHAGGAIIALVFTVPVVARRFTSPPGRIADTLVPTAGLGIILGRLGCFAEGCCFGHACDWLWCVSFPAATHPYDLHIAHGRIAPGAMFSAPVHPLQLYFAGIGVVLIAMSRWLQPRARYEGQVALLALVVFSIAAAALEPLRAGDDARVYWGPLPQLQWTALAMAVTSLAMLYVAARRDAKPHGVGGRTSG
jgi:phosphatidylglycerol:prolipoprotein diacylglycerol transferase